MAATAQGWQAASSKWNWKWIHMSRKYLFSLRELISVDVRVGLPGISGFGTLQARAKLREVEWLGPPISIISYLGC